MTDAAAAVAGHGAGRVLIGLHRFENATRGDATGLKEAFVEVIVEKHNRRILGAHTIGPQASVLIQEVVNLMVTPQRSIAPIITGMHIHPALSEVVERTFLSMMPQPR
jgi:mycothione reductase